MFIVNGRVYKTLRGAMAYANRIARTQNIILGIEKL